MKKVKTIISATLAVSMMTSLAACSEEKDSKETTQTTEVIETEKTAETTTISETTVQETQKTEEECIAELNEFKEFCKENFDKAIIYFDDEIDGILDINYDSEFESLYIKYFMASPFSDGISISFYNPDSVSLDIFTDYKKSNDYFSLSYGSYPISEIENVIFNVNKGDYILNNNETIKSGAWKYSFNECNDEQAKDVQVMYARLITMANHLLADYDCTKTIADFGLPVTDRIDSISITEMLECDERYGMPEISSDSEEWFNSLKDAITFLAFDPNAPEVECSLPITPTSVGLDSDSYATYITDTDRIRLYFRTIKDMSFLDSSFSIFLENGSDEVTIEFGVENATLIPREEGDLETGSPDYELTDSIVAFTCDKSEVLSILESPEKIMEIGSFQCQYISEEETVKALVEASKIAIPALEYDLNYLGTSLADAGIK